MRAQFVADHTDPNAIYICQSCGAQDRWIFPVTSIQPFVCQRCIDNYELACARNVGMQMADYELWGRRRRIVRTIVQGAA